jgi:hypothetical protein
LIITFKYDVLRWAEGDDKTAYLTPRFPPAAPQPPSARTKRDREDGFDEEYSSLAKRLYDSFDDAVEVVMSSSNAPQVGWTLYLL